MEHAKLRIRFPHIRMDVPDHGPVGQDLDAGAEEECDVPATVFLMRLPPGPQAKVVVCEALAIETGPAKSLSVED